MLRRSIAALLAALIASALACVKFSEENTVPPTQDAAEAGDAASAEAAVAACPSLSAAAAQPACAGACAAPQKLYEADKPSFAVVRGAKLFTVHVDSRDVRVATLPAGKLESIAALSATATPTGVAADDRELFVSSATGVFRVLQNGSGGAQQNMQTVTGTLAVGDAYVFALTAKTLTRHSKDPALAPSSPLAIDEGVDVAAFGNDGFWIAKNGATSERIVYGPFPDQAAFDGAADARRIAVDDSYVYAHLGEASTGRIVRIDRASKKVEPLVVESGKPVLLTVDRRRVYWVADRGGAGGLVLGSIDRCGTGAKLHGDQLGDIGPLSFTATDVYSASGTLGLVYRFAK